jgi:hypothetical protein
MLLNLALDTLADFLCGGRAGIVLTEQIVEPLLKATEQEIQALSFAVRWGPRYDPEMILEHAVCHLLRHRRQLERW